jgi:Lon-like protease
MTSPLLQRRDPTLQAIGRTLRNGRIALFSVIIALVCAVAAVLVLVETPYQLQMPGPITEVQRAIEPNQNPGKGELYLTTIYSDPANLAEWIFAQLNPQAGLVPRDQARPREITEREFQRILVSLMDESKIAAQVVALRAAGYDVKVTGEGVRVHEVVDSSRARGVLRPGDIIVETNGRNVTNANDLIALIQTYKPGDSVAVTVIREGERVPLDVTLGEAPDEPGRARAGISVSTYQYDYELPREFNLKTRDIGGPSAGLMFALGIYNAVTPDDITGGQRIAGTGTVTTEGRVGSVGGVKYKVMAAENARLDLFLVPKQNLEEAQSAARSIRVVPVSTFEEALDALRAIPPRP